MVFIFYTQIFFNNNLTYGGEIISVMIILSAGRVTVTSSYVGLGFS